MEIQNGRPADAAGRMDKEIRTYDFLDGLGVDYQRMDHEAAFTMEACKEVDEALGVEMCKNLFLCNRQKTDFYLLLIPGDKVFKTKELSKQIGSARLSFAGAEYMEKYLDELRRMVSERCTFATDGSFIKPCFFKHESSAVGAALYFVDKFIEEI